MKTKSCECGKLMIERKDGGVLMCDPPKVRSYWWCKCGKKEIIGFVPLYHNSETIEQRWERAQLASAPMSEPNEVKE